MTYRRIEHPLRQRRQRPSRAALSRTFGLSEEAVTDLFARPPRETQLLFAIANLLGEGRQPVGEDTASARQQELLALYARMDGARQAELLRTARELAGFEDAPRSSESTSS